MSTNTNTSARVRGLLFASTIVAATLLVGCSSGDRRSAKLRSNLTPELATLHQRSVDLANTRAYTANVNHRQAKDDWETLWLTDRPSRLTRFPMTH